MLVLQLFGALCTHSPCLTLCIGIFGRNESNLGLDPWETVKNAYDAYKKLSIACLHIRSLKTWSY